MQRSKKNIKQRPGERSIARVRANVTCDTPRGTSVPCPSHLERCGEKVQCFCENVKPVAARWVQSREELCKGLEVCKYLGGLLHQRAAVGETNMLVSSHHCANHCRNSTLFYIWSLVSSMFLCSPLLSTLSSKLVASSHHCTNHYFNRTRFRTCCLVSPLPSRAPLPFSRSLFFPRLHSFCMRPVGETHRVVSAMLRRPASSV